MSPRSKSYSETPLNKIPEPEWAKIHEIIIETNLLTESPLKMGNMAVVISKIVLDVLQRVWFPIIKHLEAKIDKIEKDVVDLKNYHYLW